LVYSFLKKLCTVQFLVKFQVLEVFGKWWVLVLQVSYECMMGSTQ
jgi:hypothetical protein